MANSYGTVTVDTTAGGTVIVANLTQRKGVLLRNNGTDIIYIGFNTSLTSANGFPINPQDTLEISNPKSGRKEVVRGIAASSSSDIRYITWDE